MNKTTTGLLVSTDGAVRRLTFDSPPTNALTEDLLSALDDAVEDAASDASIRAVLLDSAGGKYFSSGLSLDDLFGRPENKRVELFHKLLITHRHLAEIPKPTVAAIGGRAILGGWIMAMACDVRLLDEKGRIALSEVRYGLSPTEILVRRMASMSKDPTILKDLVLRGKTLRAETAFSAGFVDRLVPSGEVSNAGAAEARVLARCAPTAYAKVKAALRRASGAYDDGVWNRELRDFETLLSTAEASEGLAAMNEKRKPRWENT